MVSEHCEVVRSHLDLLVLIVENALLHPGLHHHNEDVGSIDGEDSNDAVEGDPSDREHDDQEEDVHDQHEDQVPDEECLGHFDRLIPCSSQREADDTG